MADLKRNRETLRSRSGTELGGKAADDLAREAESGYDLSKAKRRKVGRPPLAGSGASPRFSFRATPELYKAARERAEREGRTVSDLAREAVARYVKSK